MAKQVNDLNAFFGSLPKFQVAPPSPKSMPQEEKARRVAGTILTRFYSDGVCRLEDLEADAAKLGVTGRIRVTVGAGIGGRGGLRCFCDAGHVVLCKDNVLICIDRLGREWFARWLADNNAELGEFQGWLDRQPSI
jgi:hypothetical protein